MLFIALRFSIFTPVLVVMNLTLPISYTLSFSSSSSPVDNSSPVILAIACRICYDLSMKKWEISKYMSELGKKGGANRAKTLSAERRSQIARLGGLARQKKLANPLT